MKQNYMKETPILPLLCKMALPMVLSMLINSLYNIVDGVFVAGMGENAMTALSLVYPLQNMSVAISVGFGIGVNSALSYFLGKGDDKKATAAATLGIILNALHGVLFAVVGFFVMPFYLSAFSSDPEIVSMGLEYSNIILLFSVPYFISISIEKIFQAVGRPSVSMICMIVGCVTNIVLDPILIYGYFSFPALGIKGAAIATGIGQCLSLAVYVLFCVFRPLPVKLSFSASGADLGLSGRLYAVGLPAALNLALPSLLISVLNGILGDISEKYVLVLGAYYKLQTFLYLTANGIVQGMRPVIGYNSGAGESLRVRKTILYALTAISGIMCLGVILCLAIPDKLIGIFTDNPETVKLGCTALKIISIGFVFSGVSVCISGALEGFGKGGASLAISACRYAIFIIPAAFLLSIPFKAAGVWSAFPVSEVLTAILSTFLYLKYFPKNGNPKDKNAANGDISSRL